MAIYIFQQCLDPSVTAEFDINPSVYSVGDVLFSFTNELSFIIIPFRVQI